MKTSSHSQKTSPIIMYRARLALAWLLVSSGCASMLPHGPPREPNKNVPASYGGATTDGTSSAQMKWNAFFTDPKLNALIEAGLKNSQEINIVSLELDIATNEIMARKGDIWPKVQARVGAGIEKVGKHTSQGVSDEAHGVAENLPDFVVGLSASWEVDIWAKLRNATKAAALRYLASQEGRNFAITQLVGEIANSYYELMALDAELEVVKQNIAIQTNALQVVRLQKEAARVTELAVKRFEAEVLKNQSRQFAIQQDIVETETRINFLIGRFPQHVDRSPPQSFVALVPAVVHEGVPSQLLENRPDVRQAELELAAAKLDVKVAKASFYPSLGINANIGYNSFGILSLFSTPASLIYGIAAELVAPVFNWQGLKAGYRTANARQMQAVYKFERAVLQGYGDVFKQLAAIQNLEKSYELRAQQIDKLTQSIDLSSRLFASARADYMEVLLTRRDALESQMELIENKKQQLTAAVALYEALGGGWR